MNRQPDAAPCPSCGDALDPCPAECADRMGMPAARLRCAACAHVTPLVDALGSLGAAEADQDVPDEVVNAAIALFKVPLRHPHR